MTLRCGDDERGVSGVSFYRILKRIGEQPTREKERDILKRIAERNQIQIRIAVLAQGERERVLRIGTDREGRGLARLAVARRERRGTYECGATGGTR